MKAEKNQHRLHQIRVPVLAVALGLIAVGGWWWVGRESRRTDEGGFAPAQMNHESHGESGTTEADPSAPADARSTAPQVLQISVIDSSAAPIRGASVICSVLDTAWIEAEHAWPDLDWDGLARNTVTGLTNERGEVTLDVPATPRVQTVLHVLHPQYLGAMFASDGPGAPLPKRVMLKERSHLRARVSGIPSGQHSNVKVFRLLDCSDGVVASLDPLARSARRAFRQTAGVDANGDVTLAPLDNAQIVWASLDILRSGAWIGRAPADVQLDLLPTFQVGGRVTWDSAPSSPPDAWIACFAVRGMDREELARGTVRSDGGFGKLQVAIRDDCDGYVVELGGPSIARQYAEIGGVKPGELHTVEFTVIEGASFTVRVIDPNAQAIPSANVTVQWNDGIAWRRVERQTNTTGVATVDGLPSALVWVRVRASGFAPKLTEPFETDAQKGSTVVVKMAKAGIVEGRCLLTGEPARDFTVYFWSKEPSDGGKVEVHESTDGRFRIDEARPGEVVLFASGTTSIQSPQVRVIVEEAKPTQALLELPAPHTITGRVVDGITGNPISSGTVAAQITTGDQTLKPWKEATRVDAAGAFELKGLVAGENMIRVAAEGFAARVVSVHLDGTDRVDLGPIGLHHHGSLEVQLVSDRPEDFRGAGVELLGMELRPSVAVSSSGSARFENLIAGSYTAMIIFADQSARFLLTQVNPGQNVRLITRVGTGGLEVEVEAETPDLENRLYELRVAYSSAGGLEADEFYPIQRGTRIRVRTLDTKEICLEARDRERVVLGVGRFTLSGEPGEIVHFRVEGRSPVLRVVDRSRQPIAGAHVGVIGADLAPTWGRFYTTDGDGRCTLDGISFDSVGVTLRHPDYGVTAARVVELPRDDSKPLELVLDAQFALRVQVIDHTTSLPGIELRACNLARFEEGLASGTSDSTGIAAWRSVGAGEYEVSVVHPGLWPDHLRVDVNENSQPTRFQVRRLGNVVFDVKTTLGNPVNGARFELESVERNESVERWIAEGSVLASAKELRTNEQGRLTVSGLPNGDFRYRVALPNGATLEGVVTVPPSNTVERALRVD